MNNSNIEVKLRNLTFIVILGFVILGMLIIGLYIKGGVFGSRSSGTGTNSESGESTTQYDVSKMTALSVSDAVKLFDKDGVSLLYIGRSNCGVCIEVVPSLNKVQEELGYKTNYVDLKVLMDKYTYYDEEAKANKLDWSSIQKELKPLTDLMVDFKTTVSSNGEKITDTIGKLFYDQGFTPTVAVIKDGKVVDGFIGYKSEDAVREMMEKYFK